MITKRKKILFMMNPNAGVPEDNVMEKIITTFAIHGCEVTVYPILPHQGLGSENILQEHPDDYDVIACYGGDGTLNNVVNSMKELNIHKPIGYIPGGTTNDFSKSFDSDVNLQNKVIQIATGKPFAYDLGCFNGRYFNYVAAFGAFTKASYTTSREAKRILGYTAYVLNGIGQAGESLSYRRHLVIEHDGTKEEGNYIYGGITNAPSIGGMKFKWIQDSKLNDGLYEVLLIKAPDNPAGFIQAVSDLNSGKADTAYITAFRTNELNIHCDQDVEWTLDGETGTKHKDVHIVVEKQAMEIMVDRNLEL